MTRSVLVGGLLLVGVVGGFGYPASAASDGLPEALSTRRPIAEAYWAAQMPKIEAEVRPPERIALGRAQVVPGPGARAFALTDGDRRCGVLVTGMSRLLYVVEDRASVALARHNLRGAGGLHAAARSGTLELSADLTGAVIWGDGLELGEAIASAMPGALPDWVSETIEAQNETNPARDLITGRWNDDAGFRWALFDTGSEKFVLDVDPRRGVSGSESLSRLRRPVARDAGVLDRLFSVPIVGQPLDRAWGEPGGVEFTTMETEIEVENPEGALAVVRTRSRILAERDGVEVAQFSLLEGVRDSRGRAHFLTLEAVEVEGRPADFVLVRGSLILHLPRKLQRGESIWFSTRARGELLHRPEGSNYWLLGISPWYPWPGVGGEERATFRFSIAARAPFVPIAPGRELERSSSGGMNRVRTELAGGSTHLVVLAGDYTTLRESYEGMEVEVATYAFAKEDEARLVARNVLSIRACLENWLGVPYPFPNIRAVEVNTWGWGQAPAGLLLLTREHFLNAATARVGTRTRRMSRLVSQGTGSRLAHEVAHGWFPHVVRPRGAEDVWLSESVAEYVSAVCVERMTADPEEGRRAFEQELVEWKRLTSFLGDDSSVLLASWLTGGDTAQETRRQLLYGKGPVVLHALRSELARRAGSVEIGESQFFSWFRTLARQSRGRSIGTAEAVRHLEAVSGSEWRPWFERFLYGTETPELASAQPRP